MAQHVTTCQWLNRIWCIFTVLWLAFIAWRTIEVWPAIPLDMGGTDPATAAAYQSAELHHIATAVALAAAAPAITWILMKLLCRARRS